MTDEQLRHRANLYARQAMLGASEDPERGRDLHGAEVITLIARAFVIGYATGLEESARGARARK